jgi:hypothetical protein
VTPTYLHPQLSNSVTRVRDVGVYDELASFPTGLHDDAVDSTTQALNYLREPGEDGFMRWLVKSKRGAARTGSRAREAALCRGGSARKRRAA